MESAWNEPLFRLWPCFFYRTGSDKILFHDPKSLYFTRPFWWTELHIYFITFIHIYFITFIHIYFITFIQLIKFRSISKGFGPESDSSDQNPKLMIRIRPKWSESATLTDFRRWADFRILARVWVKFMKDRNLKHVLKGILLRGFYNN